MYVKMYNDNHLGILSTKPNTTLISSARDPAGKLGRDPAGKLAESGNQHKVDTRYNQR